MVTTRDRAVDAVRVAALLVGLCAHSVVPYMARPATDLLWAVQDHARSVVCDYVFWWGRSAQAQTFFLIAGFAAARARETQATRDFLAARLRRIGVPFVAGVVFVLPLVAAIWAAGWTASGRATSDEVWSWQFADVGIQRNRLGPAHLWFLQDLIVVTIAYAAVERRRWRSAWTWPLLASAGIAILTVRPAALFSVQNSFVPDPWRIAYMATFFAGGVWLADNRDRIPGRLPGALAMAGAGAAALVVTQEAGHESTAAIDRLAMAAAPTAVAWLTIAGTLAMSARHASVEDDRVASHGRAAATRVIDAALPIYILHLPAVGAVHVLLAPLAWGVAVKAAIACAITIVAAWAIALSVRTMPAALGRAWAALHRVRPAAWTTAAIAVGVSLRAVHYIRNPDVWHDEAALLVNVVERGYRSLLAPLTYHEAAPPLFLFAERWLALHLGDGTWSMRLLPLAASCAALVALVPAAQRLRAATAPVAVLLMASSNRLIDHSVEAKPYAVDVLLAAAAASLFTATREWTVTRRLVLFTALTPFLVWASYPGIFLVGGLACGMLPAVWTEHRGRSWTAFVTLAAVAAASAALLLAVPIHAQRSPELLSVWHGTFPAGLTPAALALWAGRAAIGIADYCFRPVGGVLLVPVAIGAASLVRRGEGALAAMLLAPIGLAAAAAIAHQYPFVGARVMIYSLPALSLLAAEGLGDLVERVPSRASLLAATAAAAALIPPLILDGRDLIRPWPRPATASATAFVLAARRPGDLVASPQWEYRYYFRTLGADFIPVGERPLSHSERRVWYVVHGVTSEDRRTAAEVLAGDAYRIVDAAAWQGVSVVELARP